MVNLHSYSQKKTSLPETFFNLLNEFKKDSLNIITSEDFQLEETYSSDLTNKTEFLDTFLINSKVVNGKFKILKTLSRNEPMIFLVQDFSDYNKYFLLKPLVWKFTFTTKNNKIEKVVSDTTSGFKNYMGSFLIKHNRFIEWLNLKYPNETEASLYKDLNGLLEERLKEYSHLEYSF